MSNKLYTNDSIYVRRTLRIPDSRFPGGTHSHPEHSEETSRESSCHSDSKRDPVDLTSQDYLFRLDSRIRKSKMAAKKMQRDTERSEGTADSDGSDSTYHGR
ncbi:lysM and putative peptidoglycan-binding domain-containing protein 2 [Petromyzon marinus]